MSNNLTEFKIAFVPKRKMTPNECINILDILVKFIFKNNPNFKIEYLKTKKMNEDTFIINLSYNYSKFSMVDNFKILNRLFKMNNYKTDDYTIELFSE